MQVTFQLNTFIGLELIVITDEIRAYAHRVAPAALAAANQARDTERGALAISCGDASWNAANGPRKAIAADQTMHLASIAAMLANGQAYSAWEGGVDRREWAALTAAFPTK